MCKIVFLIAILFPFSGFAQQCSNLFDLNSELETTLDYYDINAQEYNQSRSHVTDELETQRQTFINNLPSFGLILEIGAGHGRDALYFKEKGFNIVATEPSQELAKIAEAKLQEPVWRLTAQEVNFKDQFDGIWAMASLIHVPPVDLPDVFRRMRDALVPGGIIHASFIKGVGVPDQGETIPDGRYFNRVSEATLRQIVAQVGGLEIDESLTSGKESDYFGKDAPTAQFGFFNLFLRKKK